MRDKLKPYLDPKNLLKCFGILAACSLWLSIVIWGWNRGLNFAVPASSWVAKLPGSVFSTSGKLYLAQAGFVLFAFYLTVLVPDLLRRFFPGRRIPVLVHRAVTVFLLLFAALAMIAGLLNASHPVYKLLSFLIKGNKAFLVSFNLLLGPVSLGLILCTWFLPTAFCYLRDLIRGRQPFLRTFGQSCRLYGLLAALAFLLTCASACLLSVLHPISSSAYSYVRSFLIHNAASVSAAFTSIVLAPIIEEPAFRGLILHHTKRRLPFAAALLISAVFFGLWHRNPGQFVYTFFVGLVWGIIYNATGKLRHTIFLHFGLNLFAVAAFCRRSTDVFGKLTVCSAIGGFLTGLPLVPAVLIFLAILLLILFLLELLLMQTDGRKRPLLRAMDKLKKKYFGKGE